MRKITVLFIFIGILLVGTFPALAQQDNVIVVPNGTPQQLAVQIENTLRVVYYAFFIAWGAPIVQFLTALSKRLPLRISAGGWNFIWTVLFWIASVVATHLGFGDQFKTSITAIVTLASGFAGVLFTSAAASKLYQVAKAQNVAVLGYKRPNVVVSTATSAEPDLADR